MHRMAVPLGIGCFLLGLGAALWAWWDTGEMRWPLGSEGDRSVADGALQVWLDLWQAFVARCRQVQPVALPVALAGGVGALEGIDWRLSQRMRGHHAHLLRYAGGIAWALGGWVAFAWLRPSPLQVSTLTWPCLLAAGAMGFCVVAGLPARGNG